MAEIAAFGAALDKPAATDINWTRCSFFGLRSSAVGSFDSQFRD
jgi:hypothetical protein